MILMHVENSRDVVRVVRYLRGTDATFEILNGYICRGDGRWKSGKFTILIWGEVDINELMKPAVGHALVASGPLYFKTKK